MLHTIKKLITSSLPGDTSNSASEREHKRELAAVALFIEVLRSDYEYKDEEWAAVRASIREIFNLSDDEIATITTLAEEEVENSVSLYGFTRIVNDEFDAGEKNRIIEMLWRIALADGVIDKHEHHVMRKIASLLHIPHKDYIHAKQQARLHMRGRAT
jgi:uncharacterized tellurite resistance protein B-like protein